MTHLNGVDSGFNTLCSSMLSHCDRLVAFFNVYCCLSVGSCFLCTLVTFITLVNSLVMDCIHTHTRNLKVRYGIKFVRHPRHMILADLKTLFYNIFGSVAIFRPVLVVVIPLTFITLFTGVATFTHIERYCGTVGR